MKQIATLIIALFMVSALSAQGYKVGDKANKFNLLNIDGTNVSLDDYKDDNGVIVIFTCNHCPFSIAYEDRIIELDKKYKELGYPVIAINPNDSTIVQTDSYSNMIIRANEKGFTFPYLLDADQSIARTYGASRTPHVFILENENDEFFVRYIGAIDDNHEEPHKVQATFTEDAVDALLDGNNPNPDFTKAIGCTIKYSKLSGE